ncbi:hexokinase-3 isoform X2 [Sceloporus undulatus]|uniref:hexokinase-3 isoform X2 n=1 Tax=Sceloporus undulatus TaxID=8520 RepID=UPI001C4BEF81|nr:hexokinase-3 isoform X2 [Sceloporus undulatus]
MSGSERRTPKDSFLRSSLSEAMSGFSPSSKASSRVSFVLSTTTDSDPAFEDPQEFSFVLDTSTDPHLGSNTLFAYNTTRPSAIDPFEMDTVAHASRDSFSGPKNEYDATSSSFVSFAMSHSTPRGSREMQVVPKPKTNITSSFIAFSKTGSGAGQEARDMSPVHRLVPHRAPSKVSPISDQIKKHVEPFYLSKEQLLYVKDTMLAAMERGLKQKVKEGNSLLMLPSYVCALPDGTERGDFLGLELSINQVTAVLLQLTDDVEEPEVLKKKSFPFTEKVNNGNGEQVFEFLAQCLVTFLSGLNINKKYFPLGFSFPFPCDHTTLTQCKLIKWTQDCRWPGMEERDVAQMLQIAINQHCKNYQIEVLAVVNNAVGTLLSCSSDTEPCDVGLIIDHGTNCCYMEDTQRIIGMDENLGRMCLNIEWGSFGNAAELNDLLTEFDLLMDKQSMDQGKCRFDKLVGSMYLCDTVRVILASLAEKGDLFNGVLTPTLLTKGNLELQDIVEIIDGKVGLARAKNFLFRLGLVASNQDCFHVQQICQAVFTRSANLCAAGLAGVLTHIRTAQGQSELKTFLAVDGELYKSQTQYAEIMQRTLKSLAPECTIQFVPSEGGSGYGAALMAAVAVRLRNQQEGVAQILAPFQLSVVELEKLRNLMRQEMEKGLSKETHSTATVRMLPTYVRNLPDGTERGDFLALDLGGTNFRVLLVQVRSKEEGGVRMTSEIYTVPPNVAQSNAEELFDLIVNCMVDFHSKHTILGRALPLGFTFSFPCHQVSLDKGILLRWTKGFSASGCVGEDVVNLLKVAMQRRPNVDIDVVAIVNDTVGTMMSCAYGDPKCEVGLIVGTGSNACYMEEMKNIGTVEGDEGRMCINMEWGAFGDDGCLENYMTPFDKKVDAQSINAGQQRYEKLISGMYLGEIVRHILLELASRKILFKGRESFILKSKDIFPTKFLTSVEDSQGHQHVCSVLEDLGLSVSAEDALVVKEVCHTISSRAAKMCAAGVAAVVEKIRENKRMTKLEVTVGVDGTLYKMHHYFAKKLHDTVALLAPNCTVKFLLSEDGSGKGAALIAAVACHK